MPADALLAVTREALLLLVALAAPFVLAAFLTALLVGVVQAATQIHEPTLALAPRLLVVGAVLVATAPLAWSRLLRFAAAVLDGLART